MASSKSIKDKLDRIINSWQTLSAAKSFAGMTLEQFKTTVQPSYDAREELLALDEKVNAQMAARDTSDDASLRVAQMVVNAVLADPTEGPNSALYEGFGYKRKSERKTGLTRKKKKPSES